jgi:prepilin-type N-terminal cleavage/methylation domain-containing protein
MIRLRKTGRHGFTLIELVITLGLAGIIVSAAVMFFTSNLNSYRKLSNETELQFQAQYILNFMSNKIMNSEGISWVKYDETTSYNLDSVRTAGNFLKAAKISFKFGDALTDNYVFHLTDKSIRYGTGLKDMKPTVELGCYVKEIYISLFHSETLRDAEIINIKVVTEKDDQNYTAQQTAFMRNNQ